MEWVDLNAPYYGNYCSNYTENFCGRSPLNDSEINMLGISHDYLRNFSSHSYSLIYFDNPEKSPIIAMGKDSPGQRERKLAVIRKGLERLRAQPDIDWKGLGHVPGNPKLSVAPWKHCDLEAWREAKSIWRAKEEEENRRARDEGRKRLDRDAPTFPLPFPGFPDFKKIAKQE